ncbi:MAG TPA: DUF3857 domain-containing protein [Candidatus Acidoferrales bacterium]|nr:DUF3857 domain-containing protein [Candidatus Acidoferrales bacterium]
MSVRCNCIRWRLLAFIIGGVFIFSPRSGRARAQTPDGTSRAAPRTLDTNRQYQDEPFVIERHFVTVRFENDGTETRELSARVRIQTDDGAQQFRHLAFGFVSPNEDASLRSITVHKRDGGIVSQPNAGKITESATAKQFPAYANLKELSISVPKLETGDILDYDVVVRVIKPLAPGEFWFSYNFPRDGIILDDRLELNIPHGRAFNIKSPGLSRIAAAKTSQSAAHPQNHGIFFTRTIENGRTILRWKRANLKRVSDAASSPQTHVAKPADVQVTSFQNWTEAANWYARYAHIEHPSAQVTPQIRAKVQELTRGATSEQQKTKAICAYVSQQIRDVDVPGDFGQLAPRAAQDVLASGYGDSAEKNALLAAMLDAAGIRSNIALVANDRKIDPVLPSPAQFDHALTVVRDGEEMSWTDPDAALAPFGFLPASIRGISALLIQDGSRAKIVTTPFDPPFLSTQRVEIDAQLSELGKLSGTVRYSLRGDTEYVLRTAFHRAPPAQWNSLAQTILTLDGLSGHVKKVTTSDALDTEKPFEVTIAFSDPSAFTWPMERAKIALPLLTIGMPDPPAKRGDAIELGTPLDVQTHLRLRLPANFKATAPAGTEVSRDYAEFKSSYRFENGALLADRAVNFKMRELPASREPDYLAFTHAVQSDAAQALFVVDPAGAKADIPSNATADDLVDAGTAALKAGNARAAILLLHHATQLQADHRTAWNELGLAYLQSHKPAGAVEAFQRQAQVNPSDDRVHDYLGVAFEQLHRDDDAAAAFQKQATLQPLDAVAHAQLGNILLREGRYSDAIPELEKAAILSPDNAELEILLGRAYLNIGDHSKGLASLHKATTISSSAQILNEAAYTLAQQGIHLDLAAQYAERAIHRSAAVLGKADLAHMTPADFAQTATIGAYWDTLGWVYYKQGNIARAKPYIRAAWLLTENGEVGDHLAQIYAKSGHKDAAIHQCALALAGTDPVPDTRARLMLLLGGNGQIDDLIGKNRPELEKIRTFALHIPVKEKASADFLIAMSPAEVGKARVAAHVDTVRFVSGDESLRRFANDLRSIDYGEVFPDATPLKLIRRGTLACSPEGECKLNLALPENSTAH